MVKIAPSILAVNFDKLEKEIKSVEESKADYIHVDVMDGEFVNNTTPGMEMIEKSKKTTNLPLDIHLMVSEPERWIDEIISIESKYNSTENDTVIFHIEAVNEQIAYRLIKKLHDSNLKVGLSIKPNTSILDIITFLPLIDMVLVMTVEPGYGGQKMIESCLSKVKFIRNIQPEIDIEVDGGINLETARLVKEAGANILVAGTAIFKSKDKKQVIECMRNN